MPVSLKDKISSNLKEAMKKRDALSVGSLRLILAAIKNREIEKRGELADDECQKVLMSLAKQRGESIELYQKGGRKDLVDKETFELKLIESFLPEQLSDEELDLIVKEVAAEVGASGQKDVGKVMKALGPRVRGRADGKRMSEVVKRRLQEV